MQQVSYLIMMGTKIYVVGGNNSSVYEYDVSTAYDISTSSYNGNSYLWTNGSYSLSQSKSLAFNSDGTKMFILNQTNTRVEEYNLSTPYNPALIQTII